ncbi:Calcium-dependent kinase 26 [Paramuricea clavata]|uniref:Calcium-dependent kinase 26 n=1 Tax=Paramuricea clavata TaxID=317549 RepID=A0A7D9HF11_PARCT|nr:Calcium-dependent kinase 26 [Paramuricea clavata]
MSVGVPIYRRILYGSPAFTEREEKRATSAREREQSIEPCHSSAKDTNPRTLPSEGWESTRHTLSALSIHKGSEIIPRAVSAPAVYATTKSAKKQCPQSERWKERKQNLTHSRTVKKKSNIIAHRQDNGYYIAGSKLPLVDRYDIDEDELIKLRMLAHSRAEKSTRASSVNSSVMRGRAVSPGMSPSGQNSSPVPPTFAVEAEKRKKILERRSQMKDDREIRKEMRREQQREKLKRFEEKQEFEKQMEEKYKPKKPEKRSLIFLTEQSDDERKQNQRVFLTESDFMIDEEEQGSTYSFVNEKQRLAFSSIFNEMDKNQDGRIDINELKQNLFPLASKNNLKHLLQVFDLNKDHMVEMREFITICALNDQLCGTRTESGTTSLALDLERLAQHITIYKELFDVIDEDRDGHIQTDEIFLMITTAVTGDERVDEDEARRVLDNMEKDEKGYIDFTSFMSYIPFFAKLLQVIMDSPLSIKNLEQARDRVIRKYSSNPDETM